MDLSSSALIEKKNSSNCFKCVQNMNKCVETLEKDFLVLNLFTDANGVMTRGPKGGISTQCPLILLSCFCT